MRVSGLGWWVLVALAGLAAVNCAGSPNVCTPGASVACVGPGGCAGGQVCSADGQALLACVCGPAGQDAGSDGGVGDAGTPDAGPTFGYLLVNWSLGADSCPHSIGLMCSQILSDTIAVTMTNNATAAALPFTGPCVSSYGGFQVGPVPFGSYTVDVAAINTAQAALTNAWTQAVTFDATQCTFTADGGCGRTVEVCLVKP